MSTISTFATSTTVTTSVMQNQLLDHIKDDGSNKHNYCCGINKMHHLQIEAGGSVWILLSEKIHEQI